MKKIFILLGLVGITACSSNGGGQNQDANYYPSTPTVDYVERLDVRSAQQSDSFLNQLAMNYRSYAIFNARQSGHADIGELFAQKSVAAFSGETPFPEPLDNWVIQNQNLGLELQRACQDLINMLKDGMSDYCPIEAAEAQAKYDCWLSATASGQLATANECRSKFISKMDVLSRGPQACARKPVCKPKVKQQSTCPVEQPVAQEIVYYPEPMAVMPAQMRARESVVIVNNVNLPEHLIRPEPVQPMVFNQNIYGGDKSVSKGDKIISGGDKIISGGDKIVSDGGDKDVAGVEVVIDGDYVSREEFIAMMLSLREEIAVLNGRLDSVGFEKAVLKVQQIPLEPKQRIMEEVFEVHFDFDKSKIKPEYAEVIRKLSQVAQDNRNLKVSVVGHTDTKGSADYNYALGGRRAEAVRKMLVSYGIPADQIVTVSSGKQDLKVQTGDQVENEDNRRVRVVKEQRFIEQPSVSHVNALVEEEIEIE